jgi:hypothetical protein
VKPSARLRDCHKKTTHRGLALGSRSRSSQNVDTIRATRGKATGLAMPKKSPREFFGSKEVRYGCIPHSIDHSGDCNSPYHFKIISFPPEPNINHSLFISRFVLPTRAVIAGDGGNASRIVAKPSHRPLNHYKIDWSIGLLLVPFDVHSLDKNINGH